MKTAILWVLSHLGNLAALVARGLEFASPYVRAAYDLAKRANEDCGGTNRTLAAVLQFAEEIGVREALEDGNITTRELGAMIRDAIFAALRKQFPDAPDRRLNRAIESAYGAVRP